MKKSVFILSLLCSLPILADWHSGNVEMVAIGYDGKTISIGQAGSTRTNCTCYSTWPNRYCLDNTRDTFKEEYSLILSAKARNKSLNININEDSCKITAIYEN
jgi:hypothetical protein